jgi:catechol 2,3-dioxygenase
MGAIPFAATTPTSVSQVGIRARDAEKVARYYREVIGLTELSRGNGAIVLGAGERPMLVIEADAAAKPDDPRSAGLFHNAFLLPSRADLGRWINHAIDRQIPIEGASDHLVSEALYLSDPEGNGIEVYADRPREKWAFEEGGLKMATIRLNIPSVLADVPEGDAGWQGAPDGSVIGHVHLRVGDPLEAERWWHQELGFDTMARYGAQAVFLSSGGYHHHIGANSWRSPGAGRRDAGRAGLSWVELKSSDHPPAEHTDPWGTVIRTVVR